MAASTSLVADKADCGEAVANFNRIIGVIFTLENHPTNTFMLLGTKTALTDGFVHKLCDIVFDTTREVKVTYGAGFFNSGKESCRIGSCILACTSAGCYAAHVLLLTSGCTGEAREEISPVSLLCLR